MPVPDGPGEGGEPGAAPSGDAGDRGAGRAAPDAPGGLDTTRATGAFDRVRFILVEPSHVGNIGSCARAIRSMGFAHLCVVAPRDPAFRTAPEAVALAAGAGDVLAQATVYESLAQALHGVQLAFATTGYAREFGALPLEVRAAAQECAQVVLEPAAEIAAASRVETAVASATASTAGSASTVRAAGKPAGAVAFVFGPERTGLSNADVQRCHQCCSIPADPVRGSLNLSQAAQVVAYETRREILAAAGTHDTPAPRRDHSQPAPRNDDPPASVEQTEAMFEHLAQGLAAVGYLDPAEPKHLLARIRRLLLRARPTVTEVDILRGIASAMVLPRRLRAGSKKMRDGD